MLPQLEIFGKFLVNLLSPGFLEIAKKDIKNFFPVIAEIFIFCQRRKKQYTDSHV
jgi:hypothetical protein